MIIFELLYERKWTRWNHSLTCERYYAYSDTWELKEILSKVKRAQPDLWQILIHIVLFNVHMSYMSFLRTVHF